MRMPGADRAVVDEAKVRDYLLSFEHPVGRAKARIFAALGFHREAWAELRLALLAFADTDLAELGSTTAFGQKYVVRGTIQGPTGQSAAVATAWIILAGEDFPRFVTAFPGDRP